jgi:hypothetical protein
MIWWSDPYSTIGGAAWSLLPYSVISGYRNRGSRAIEDSNFIWYAFPKAVHSDSLEDVVSLPPRCQNQLACHPVALADLDCLVD